MVVLQKMTIPGTMLLNFQEMISSLLGSFFETNKQTNKHPET